VCQQRNGEGVGAAQLRAHLPFETFVRERTPVLYGNVHFPEAPTGGCDSGQEAVVDLAGHGVALAGRALQTGPVDDRHPPP